LFFDPCDILIKDMCLHKFRLTLFALGCALILGACGDFNMVLSLGETYRISARADTALLDDCGIIGASSRIRPHFINPISNDPDVTGLSVFLRSSGGDVVSKKVHYSLIQYRQPEQEDPSWTDDFTETGSSPGIPEETGGEAGGKENTGGDTQGTDGKSAGDQEFTGSAVQSDKSGKSDFLPQISPRWDTAVDGTARMARVYLDNARSEDTTDIILYVNQLNNELPPFLLPEELELGQYTLVFQLMGDREILHQVEKSLYYLGDAEFTLEDIQTYLPGFSGGAHTVSPGTMVLLETRVVADERLDPYVIWYNGKKRIGEGMLIDGNSRLMWTVPTQTGFHAIWAEIFPFPPQGKAREVPAGKVKELSLPVSSKQAGKGYFDAGADTFIRWYQFPGNLEDAKAPGNTSQQIQPQNGVFPQWLPQGGIYGLALEAGDVYNLPRQSFDLPEGAVGRGRFMIRFAPLGEGVIFSGTFQQGSSPSDAVVLELVYTRNELVLRFTAAGEKRENRRPVFHAETDGFITAVIHFQLEKGHFYAGLGLDYAEVFNPDQGITLVQPLSGGGSFQLGMNKPVITGDGDSSNPDSSNAGSPAARPLAIIDELALDYTLAENGNTPVPAPDIFLVSPPREAVSALSELPVEAAQEPEPETTGPVKDSPEERAAAPR
jgi:hypothetical protein